MMPSSRCSICRRPTDAWSSTRRPSAASSCSRPTKRSRFAHWGRPINYAGRLASYKAEFANDLERMLMLGASAKDEDEGVTGKFGLGFKSVLLASSTPRIWSGDLCFDVVAGCLPRKWKASSATKQFQQAVQTPSQRALRGTLIELPLDSRGAAAEVTERFAALAGLLPVFARKLRCVVVGEEPSHLATPDPSAGQWQADRDRSVALPVEGGRIHSGILVFRAASGECRSPDWSRRYRGIRPQSATCCSRLLGDSADPRNARPRRSVERALSDRHGSRNAGSWKVSHPDQHDPDADTRERSLTGPD